MVLVSAHRGGAGDVRAAQNTLAAFEAAIAAGCDYVEFDVRVTADGTPVIFHDPEVDDGTVRRAIAGHRADELTDARLLLLDDVLDLIAGRVNAHVDLKVAGHEIELAEQVVGRLGVDHVILTTAEDASVRRLMAWSKEHAPGMLVGLSTGRRAWRGGSWARRLASLETAFPRTRIRRSGANLVVAHKSIARWSLRSYAKRRDLPMVVWTVDDPAELRRWMNDPHTWMVTTNHPARAFAARR